MSYRYNGESITVEKAKELQDEGKRIEPPWLDIGYHFGIEKINDIYEILIGRLWNQTGAHTIGHNNDIGICCVGNYDVEEPDPNMLFKLMKLTTTLCDTLGISLNNVVGHRNFADKTCPGNRFNVELFRRFCLTPWDKSLIGG